MTCVIGALTKNDGIVLASDSYVEDGTTKTLDYEGKLWSNGNYILGASGTVRVIQVIKYFFDLPEFRDYHKDNIEKFVVKEIVPVLKEVLRENEILETNKKIISFDAEILIGWEDNICSIGGDFCVTIPPSKRIATGSGIAQSLGSLDNKKNNWTKRDIVRAVESANLTAIGVGGSIYTISTKNPKVEIFDINV
jgi:hypothetical protein